MKNKIILCGVLLLLVVSGACQLAESPPEKIKVNLGHKLNMAYAHFFVSLEKGYFEEQGLDVNPVIFDSTNQLMGAVISGHVDAAMSGNAQTILSIEEKSPGELKIFTLLKDTEEVMFTCVMVKKDSEITELTELENARIAVLPGTYSPLWTRVTLKELAGVENIDILGLSPKLQLSALESGQVDALSTVEPLCTFGINKGIGKIVYRNPLIHFATTVGGSVLSADFAEKNPEAAKKIVAATDKAIDYMRENPEESIKIMAKYTGYKEELTKGLQVPAYAKSTEINVDDIQELADKLYELGNLKTRVDASGMIYE